MPYIGKTPTVGNFQVCDAISVVNGQAAYTLQVGGVNVAPESANHMLVSLNGILQKPGSSFTISGSTMTFASNLATGDVIDFVQILGNVLDIGQPSDDTVTAAKLNNDIISGQTALTSEPDDTDEFLVSDAGTIKRIDYSLIKGAGKVLQVVGASTSTQVGVTANSYTDTGLTADITPASTSNKVLVLIHQSIGKTAAHTWTDIKLLRGSTQIGLFASVAFTGEATANYIGTTGCSFLDTPSSTSSLTYKTQFRNVAAAGTVNAQVDSGLSSITLMEIAG